MASRLPKWFIWNLCSTDVMVMTYLNCFLLLIMQINLKSIGHLNIFSLEKHGCLPFLNVNIFRRNETFATNIYGKKNFRGVSINFKSIIPETNKIGLIKSLLFWCFSLCSDFIKFHHDIDQPPCIDKFRGILYKSSYSRVIWFALKNFLKKYWHQKLQ